MGEDTKENNVIDFTTHKLKQLAKEYAKGSDVVSAIALKEAYEQYIRGEIKVMFSGGLPYIVLKKPKDPEVTE